MTMELYSLLACSGILLMLMFAQQLLVDMEMGTKYALGNREEAPKGAMIQRMLRAQSNLVANLAMFVPIVVVAAEAGVSNKYTAYGALAFVGFRVLHALTYTFGITLIRSLGWIGGIISMGVMTFGILSA